LASLGFAEWEEALLCGVAAHHAGLIPVFKETVEHLFRQKLVKVVFATDTLALGINMPARSVVIEKLEKFNGESRVPITPGEYTQLTGRAGRRGIDTEGHAVIVWRSGMNPHALGALASRRSYPLYSSFKPTYNMAVNLIERYGRQVAREILEESLAQFQADRAVVTLARDVKKNQAALKDYETAMECHLGDFAEYSAIRRELSDLERKDNQAGPGPVSVRQKRLAQIEKLRSRLRKHSCHSCPDREQHARWAERYWRLRKQVDSASREIEGKTGAIAVRFDRVCNVLTELGYLEVQNGETFVSQAGANLRRIYGERDLLVAECIRRGLWDELDAQTLVAVVSCVVYEARRDDDNWQMGRLPKGKFPEALLEMEKAWDSVTVLEDSARLPETPALATGLALGMQRWAKGQRLDSVLRECNLAGGDFVRWTKQVIDGLDQISKVSSGELGDTARHAITLIRRGIVADSATL
ncbi:MAG: helicase-related protein, partial [Microbacteriaceae bacterium]